MDIQNYSYSYEEIVNIFHKRMKTNSILNASIIYGAHGNGKSYLSNRLAQILLSSKNKANIECGHLNSPDLYSIYNESTDNRTIITIDIIKNMKSWINCTNMNSKYKVVIIDDVDRMNINAQNSLLKTLETNFNNVVYIFNTSYIESIIDTMQSRCIKMKLDMINLETFKSILLTKFNTDSRIDLEILYDLCNRDLTLSLEIVKNRKLSILVDLYSEKNYVKMKDVMYELNIENSMELRLFKCLVFSLIDVIIKKCINNGLIKYILSINIENIQYMLFNIQLLNKKRVQHFIIKNLIEHL